MGLLTLVSTVSAAVMAVLDNDPATNPDWSLVAAGVTAGLGLLLAKDASK